jgi:hypothetical protein
MGKDPHATALGRKGGKKTSKVKKLAVLRNLLKAHKARKYEKPISKKLLNSVLDGHHQSA